MARKHQRHLPPGPRRTLQRNQHPLIGHEVGVGDVHAALGVLDPLE
jgi:hypothetical protein